MIISVNVASLFFRTRQLCVVVIAFCASLIKLHIIFISGVVFQLLHLLYPDLL